ncbi:MAG: putative peptidoglycan glycosyltransferase FtsW [Tissierellia bacterium]|nr:putative peptidoglycan glycosyltransferase FtsW [Tissierellia bacterium]
MKRGKSVDILLLAVMVLLLLVGIFMVSSASWPAGSQGYGDGYHYLKRHLAFVVLGLFAALVGYVLPLNFYRKFSLVFWLGSLFLCLLLFSPLARAVNGSTRWIVIPGTEFQFMPADFLKYASLFFMADLLTGYRKMGQKRGFVPLALVIGISAALVAKEDFSSAVVIAFGLLSMYFLAGMALWEFLAMGIGSLLVGGAMVALMPYRVKRMTSFQDPFDDLLNTDWQLANSLFAIAMGRMGGVGYFSSTQKLNNLPEAYNDFIFAVIAEEFGFLGVVGILTLYILLVVVGFRVAFRQKETYNRYLAVGITSSIGIQAFFNMGVASGILPVTGITLPYISYGGTALVLLMAMSGVLLRLSREGDYR